MLSNLLKGPSGKISLAVVLGLIAVPTIAGVFFLRASQVRVLRANGAVGEQKKHELANARNIWSSFQFETDVRNATVLKAIADNVASAEKSKDAPPLTPIQITAAREAALLFFVGYSSSSE